MGGFVWAVRSGLVWPPFDPGAAARYYDFMPYIPHLPWKEEVLVDAPKRSVYQLSLWLSCHIPPRCRWSVPGPQYARTSPNRNSANFRAGSCIDCLSEPQGWRLRGPARRAASGPVVTEDGSCSARELTEPTQRPDAGHEVVVPATVAHERGKPSETSADGPLRDGERVVLGVRGDEGVDLVGSAHGAAVVDPLFLHELELACDVGIEGHEDESSVGAVVFEQSRFEPGPVGRAAADDAVKPHFAADDGVARVRAASVRPNGALEAALVVAVEEVVVAGVVGTERRVVFVRRERERGAAGPAPHDLRGDPLGVRVALRGASDVAAESGDIRVQLAEDQVAPIPPQGVGLGDGSDAARLVGVAQYELSRFDRLLLGVRGGDPAAFHRGLRDAVAEIEGVAPVLG